MIDVGIKDGFGSGNTLKINSEGELFAVVHPHPPRDEKETSIPFQSYFTTTAGSSDMAVNGATTNQAFSINADAVKDKYIRTVNIIIVDAGQTLQEFGNTNAALTNGVKLVWETEDLGTTIISDSLKTNFDFLRLAQGLTTFDVILNAVPTNLEAFVVKLDFQEIFGVPYGLRLRAGTNDKIEFTIRDDCSGVDQFDAIGYGFKI